jgi:hypothetical protein
MNTTTQEIRMRSWFIFGVIVMALLAMYVPKVAGGVAILIALVLAMRATQAGLV